LGDGSRTAGSWAERGRHVEVGLVAQQHVLVGRVDAREVPQQIADVGADAEVVELAGIDRDTHQPELWQASGSGSGFRPGWLLAVVGPPSGGPG
jgi:hypothetical protein